MEFDEAAIVQLGQYRDAAQSIARALTYTLSREYLNNPLENAAFARRSPAVGQPSQLFLRLEQVGSLPLGLTQVNQAFKSFQTALSSVHNVDQQSLIFLLCSDGLKASIYLGLRSEKPADVPDVQLVERIGQFISGNWAGTRFQLCSPTDEEFKQNVYERMQGRKSAFAITGIPSLKSVNKIDYPVGLERLIRGMQGSPFVYMVVADPIRTSHNNVDPLISNQPIVDEMLDRCRDLLSYIHTFNRITLSESLSLSHSTMSGSTTTEMDSQSISRSETKGTNRQVGANVALGTLAAQLANLLPTMNTVMQMALAAGTVIGPSFTSSWQNSRTNGSSETISTGMSEINSDTFGQTSGRNLGREFIDAHTQAAETYLLSYAKRFEEARKMGLWNVGAYLIADDDVSAQIGASQLRSLCQGEESNLEPIRIHSFGGIWGQEVIRSLQKLDQPNLVFGSSKEAIEHPFGSAFNPVTTPLTTDELCLLINFPYQEVPGIKLASHAEFGLNPFHVPKQKAINLGDILENGLATSVKYSVDVDALVKHVLVTGVTGSGKSRTCITLLCEAMRHDLPFLVIEPAKEEYVALALQFNSTLEKDDPNRIHVFIPGLPQGKWQGHIIDSSLRLNPFDIAQPFANTPPIVLPHIDRVISILNASFPMPDALPIYLEDVLYSAYADEGWLDESGPSSEAKSPTVTKIIDIHLQRAIQKIGFDERTNQNLISILRTRFEHLRKGWRNGLYNQQHSTSPSELFERRVVVNLAYLGDDADKAFMMALLFQYLTEYRQAQHSYYASQDIPSPTVRHLTILEEAHRFLRKNESPFATQGNPQAKVGEMFANMISEIRAYGEGLIIVEQSPTRLVSDVIKNTNLKIVHRLVSREECDAIASSLALSPEQSKLIPRLRPGQAIVFGDQDDTAFWVQIQNDA